MNHIRINFDTKRELENRVKYQWLKGKEVTMTEFRSMVYDVGQKVLEKEFSKHLNFWETCLKRANGE